MVGRKASWSLSIVFVLGCATAAPNSPGRAGANEPEEGAMLSVNPEEDCEACIQRVMSEGLPTTSSAPPEEGDALLKAALVRYRAKDYKGTRVAYYQLIQKAPRSPYIPLAYLAFGELFFHEGQSDPSKWTLAAMAYQQVLKYPAPSNRVFLVGMYRLVQARAFVGQESDSRLAFQRALAVAADYPQQVCAKEVAASARFEQSRELPMLDGGADR
jgi:hypothetical protein